MQECTTPSNIRKDYVGGSILHLVVWTEARILAIGNWQLGTALLRKLLIHPVAQSTAQFIEKPKSLYEKTIALLPPSNLHIMAEQQLGRSTFHRRKPEDICVKASERQKPHVADTTPNELIFTPDTLIDDGPDSVTFSVRCSPVPFGRSPSIQSAISSPRNFFLEKPPAGYYRTEESPISPGVTVLLSPTSYDEDGSDADAMDFFRAATYKGPQTLQIIAEKTRVPPQPVNVKKRTAKATLPSPITPKAWPCMEEPDISTLPSLKDHRNALDAISRLAEESSQAKKAPEPALKRSPPTYDNLPAKTEASKPLLTRPVARSRPSDTKHSKRSGDAGKRRSRSFSAQQKDLLAPPQTSSVSSHIQRRGSPSESWKRRSLSFDSQQQLQLLLMRQNSRSPSNESDDSTSSGSKQNHKWAHPASEYSSGVSRTPSPVFDDEDDITDFESVTDVDADDNDHKFYGCDKSIEVLAAQSHGAKKQPTFRCQQGSDAQLRPTRNYTAPLCSPAGGLLTLKDTLPRAHTAHNMSSESIERTPIVPPPRRRSPPAIPIHRDEVKVTGASFAPSESRTPRTLVANWLAGISNSAGRNETLRENEVKKSRKWGRKPRHQPETWI
ncbi:hypothetical protein CJF31_00000287 [Rutstroemia sp. NJR-2017a BVV2]|nr:hypothetical protein CJF31_00000287 [Rutstroemia sp. NJR-2017a BVV2]